jgi:hypothetical protein
MLCARATTGTNKAARSASARGRQIMTTGTLDTLAAIWGSDDDEFGMAGGLRQGHSSPVRDPTQHSPTRTSKNKGV